MQWLLMSRVFILKLLQVSFTFRASTKRWSLRRSCHPQTSQSKGHWVWVIHLWSRAALTHRGLVSSISRRRTSELSHIHEFRTWGNGIPSSMHSKCWHLKPVPDSLIINGLGAFECSMAVPSRPVECKDVQRPSLKLREGRTRLRIVNVG